MLGRKTSMPYFASPVVLAGMSRAGMDLPMTLYWPRGLSGTFLKSCRDERHAARGAGTRQAIELGRHAPAVHRVREAIDREVLGTFLRRVKPDVVPLDFQFFGDDLRERGS